MKGTKCSAMTKSIFRNNLLSTICSGLGVSEIDENTTRFMIAPMYDERKSHTGLDEMMRLGVLSEENIGGKEFTIDQVVGILACNEPLVPINIIVSTINGSKDKFSLMVSTRVRKPSQLANQETGHAPFKFKA